MNAKISVIIPVYKVEPYLRQCLDSVVNQTYKNLEIILIDDGSPDNCGKICDEYAERDERIVVIHKKNGGLSAARNDRLKLAAGQWISFVDPDDWCELDMYEKSIAKAIETSADMIIFSPYQNSRHKEERIHAFSTDFVTEDPKMISQLQLSALNVYYTPLSQDHRWGQGFPWDRLYKSSVIKDNNLTFSESVRANEDVIFNILAFQYVKKVAFFDLALYHWRMNPASIGHKYTPDRVEVDREVYQVMEDIGKTYGLSEEYFQAVYLRTVNNILALGQRCFFHPAHNENFLNSLKSLAKALDCPHYSIALQKVDRGKLSRGGKLLVICCKQCRALVIWALTKRRQVMKHGFMDI